MTTGQYVVVCPIKREVITDKEGEPIVSHDIRSLEKICVDYIKENRPDLSEVSLRTYFGKTSTLARKLRGYGEYFFGDSCLRRVRI